VLNSLALDTRTSNNHVLIRRRSKIQWMEFSEPTTAGFARMVERTGVGAGLAFKAHPHMLRHACGYALANRGHDTRALQAYLGHRNIQHTVRYTELSPTRFKDFWRV
jgi:site-specific recombinase XerD